MNRLQKLMVVCFVLFGMLAIGTTAFAANECPSSCATVALSRSNLVGDFYAGDVLVQSQVNRVTLVASNYGGPGTYLQVTARNIHDGSADDGVLYSYQDASRKVKFPKTGQTASFKLTSQPKYLRAKLEVTCDMRNFTGGDVACLLRIDGANIATIGAGQKGSFTVEPGTHLVEVLMAGSQAAEWSPASYSKSMTFKARSAAYKLTATFKKNGQVVSPPNQPTATPVTPTAVPSAAPSATPPTTTPVPPTATPVPASGPDYTTYDDGSAMLFYVNYARCAMGLTPLALNSQLNYAATKHSIDMAVNNYFSHTGLNGSDPGMRISAEGYNWITYGENIAAGNGDVRATFDQWWNSPGHKANILNPDFRDMGLGHVYRAASNYGHYWTQVFGSTGTAAGVCQ